MAPDSSREQPGLTSPVLCSVLCAPLRGVPALSIAATASSVRETFEQLLNHIPTRSRLNEALLFVHEMHRAGRSWEEAIEAIQEQYGHYSWVHAVNNAAVIAAALLWGNEDYATTVGITVQGGWDTDSNGATAGSVAGTVLGAAALPPHFIEPLQDRTRSAVFGYDNFRISDLAQRMVKLASSLGNLWHTPFVLEISPKHPAHGHHAGLQAAIAVGTRLLIRG